MTPKMAGPPKYHRSYSEAVRTWGSPGGKPMGRSTSNAAGAALGSEAATTKEG
jgi:hypothetical protein